jgi:hypothetical protein
MAATLRGFTLKKLLPLYTGSSTKMTAYAHAINYKNDNRNNEL